MKRKNVYALVGMLALLALIAKIAATATEKKAPDGGDASAAVAAFTVTSITAKVSDMRAYIELNGLIEADNTVEACPEINGRYARQLVALGDRVRKGDIIATVDPSKPGAPYSMSPIRAPISGTVVSLPQKIGSTVTTETVIAKIGDIDHLQVRLQIPEREIGNLRRGLPAVVSVEAYPKESFTASINRVSPLVEPVSHTKDAYLAFDREDGRINAGMFARVKLYTRQYRGCVIVPDDAIQSSGDTTIVYVIAADGTARARPVEKETSIDGYALLRKGVAAGEKVVVEGASLVSDGAKVRDIATSDDKAAEGTNHE